MKAWLRIIGASAAAAALSACDPATHYSQDSPEATFQSAVDMVKNGDADQLTDLIYADSGRMRTFLDRVGVLLGHMGELAVAVQKHCPGEVESLKTVAEARVQDGSIESLFAAFGAGSGRRGEGRAGEVLARVYADPYGWLERGAERISFITLTDDVAIIHFDDRPALSAAGIALKKENNRWYLQLPTSLAAKYMPRTEEQWLILESTVAIFDQAARDLTAEVRSGQIGSLAELGRRAEERLLISTAIAAGAYMKEMDVRDRAEKTIVAYRRARKTWEEWRADQPGLEPVVSGALRRTLDRIAVVQLEHAARLEEEIDFAAMSAARFQTLIAEWLKTHGVPVSMDEPLAGDALEARIEAWDKAHPTITPPKIERQRSSEPLRWLRRPG